MPRVKVVTRSNYVEDGETTTYVELVEFLAVAEKFTKTDDTKYEYREPESDVVWYMTAALT